MKMCPHAAQPGSELASIPEYFAKPGITEALAQSHPVLLVRQMANEILRLRAAQPSREAVALLRKWFKAASGDSVGNDYFLPLDFYGTGTQATAKLEEAEFERELLGPTRALLAKEKD